MRRHVSAEVLARYQEGDLGARRSASVAAHLSTCEQCAQTGSDLTAVSGLLASMGQPVMPPALADRLQLAIARESEARASAHAVSGAQLAAAGPAAATAAGAGADGVADAGLTDSQAGAGAGRNGLAGERDAAGARIPGRPDLPERSRRRGISWPRLHWPGLSSPALLRGTAAIAVVLVLTGAGFLLARGVSGPESASSNGSGSSGKRAAAPASGGAAHRAESNQVPASVTGSARLHYRLHGKIVTTTALASHLNFTKHGLAGQVHRAVASHVGFGTVTTPPTTASPANGQTGSPLLGGIKIGTLNGCLSRVSAGRQVVLTEIARYLGRPATIIVLKSLTANILDVAIVRVACSSSAADYIVRTTVPAS